eukprot:CAMPEP_0201959586 /NCGR_PEP_ID=MMETSP0904-20121228/6485_1 /ASSEMBLY_ACC=CAM_ASM_000553 /TAXON_ID=420261 /ORGANISM="Thalassiosira antarctica, Strain CCMP982" /LENGTH=33 /DNA_ID= /DNA_START= /DNA_END= /DNA_ORIENTATION=
MTSPVPNFFGLVCASSLLRVGLAVTLSELETPA